MVKLGEGGIGHDRGDRQVGGGDEWRSTAPMLMPKSAIGPRPLLSRKRTAAATSRRSWRAKRHEPGSALTMAAKVELQDVVPLAEPWHESSQLAEVGARRSRA